MAMITTQQLLAFLAVAVLLTCTPGPDNLMVLSVGMSKGRQRGIAFGLGCALGCLSHTFLAVLGVSALIVASPVAFFFLKIVGSLYLIWLGFNVIKNASKIRIDVVKEHQDSPSKLFFRGCFANAVNPKVILFFLSFLPQFVDQSHAHVSMQLGILGLAFTVQAAVIFSSLGYFSGAIGHWLKARPKAGVVLDRMAGAIFIALGLRLVIAR